MSELLDALINRRHPVDLDMCRAFWDRLGTRKLHPGEAAALLASLSTGMPSPHTVEILVQSLDERRPQPSHRFPGAVNIVGTGGGPRTFNISTAAAFIAAAMGVPVVKTGSRGYTSRTGSLDLLEGLGIPLTTSYQQTGELLDRYNIACAGYFVYPVELAALARAVAPLQMRTLGRFVNTVGPFLAAMPVSAQLTGVSEHRHLATLRHLATRQHLAAQQAPKRVWLCTNDLGADELISVADNLVHDVGAGQFQVRPGALGLGGGTMADLLAAPADTTAGYFLDVLGGTGPPAAVATVCLNAAALAVAAGAVEDWASAVSMARDALDGGAAVELVHRIRRDRAAALPAASTPEAVRTP
ncbi:MAG: anthranilate phosphoribosyltransferase [Pseudonocardiaceae bacterium]